MKIKIMQCLWNKSLEGKVLDVDKVTSKQPTIKVLIDKIASIEEQIVDLKNILVHVVKRLDNIVKLNNLKE